MTDIKAGTALIIVERDDDGVWVVIEDDFFGERADITLQPPQVRELIAALEKELSNDN